MQMGKVKLVCYHHRDVQSCNTKTVSCLAPVVCSTRQSMNAQESKAIGSRGTMVTSSSAFDCFSAEQNAAGRLWCIQRS